jgi:ABC-type transport system involved in multi-copper enzyme maturation permease subunit
MTESFEQLLLLCPLLALLQVLAALPWLAALDPALAKAKLRRPASWGWLFLGTAGAGVLAALYLDTISDRLVMGRWGRLYAGVLQLQLTADFFVVVFFVLLYAWPRGGAVALAAFREGVRQPMFWLLTGAGLLLLAVSPFLPYFTFGEDYKMVKELGLAQAMLFSAVFVVIAASSSIAEEIEGRTAITLMSKPVSRRQFLLGKFVGILLAGLVMALLIGWCLVWVLLFKQGDPTDQQQYYSPEPDPAWLVLALREHLPVGPAANFLRGVGLWFNDTVPLLPLLTIGFGHVMVLLAVAVALATRLPMLVNVPVCLFVYLLGHLTPILKAVAASRIQEQETQYKLVKFLADVFDVILPGLDLFDLSPAVIRDAPLPPADFTVYTLHVSAYAVMYTTIALLFGLVLFEDRDLA